MERDGVRVSTLDLVAHDRFTLIAGPGAPSAIVKGVERSVRVLVTGRDFIDPHGRWTTLSGIGDDGALLIRPDQHVAWRARAAAPSTFGAIAHALARILNP